MADHVTQSAKKRARLDEPGDSAEQQAAGAGERVARKDPDFWFDDGTVALVARDVEFRVYKGILAEHSPVFADMFSLPQSSAECGTRVPVVHLTDSPEDVRHVMRALYPKKGTISMFHDTDKPSYYMISAYARLGHKYQIDDLMQKASGFLKAFYTNDYDTWYRSEDFQPSGWSRIQTIGVVNMARLLDCPTILPTALSTCCTLPAKMLLDGMQREDGTIEQLDYEDLARCIDGMRSLTQATTRNYLRVIAPLETPGCRTRAACEIGIRKLLHNAELVAGKHPFFECGGLAVWMTAEEETFCQLCEKELERRVRDEQRITWRRFPELMSLTIEGWVTEEEQG
ncbi:hypothetical protein C8Q80DRAFT_907174 [Daedaleopsis nitida]|nr:hypothetical protein C8Q80DRAFT_907174 [Daedaleopsis nitida]